MEKDKNNNDGVDDVMVAKFFDEVSLFAFKLF